MRVARDDDEYKKKIASPRFEPHPSSTDQSTLQEPQEPQEPLSRSSSPQDLLALKSKTNPKMRSMSTVATLAAFLLISSSVSAAAAPLTAKIELSDVFSKVC
ncbi:hypothetical protein KI688_001594 [Linnemannia hyalina]|uniref:Uncharacterized protein n=1 Tax=Linnemannia hyalina TaxID=64524 RepID=A0A9P8BSB0_9FUNG|nr:hypothetical protein KI688_001594 [Linnemannia hyalina]